MVCGGLVQVEFDSPTHYHQQCAMDARGLPVVWHGFSLQYDDGEDLSWTRDHSDQEEGLYLGVAFDDNRGVYTAAIQLHGVETEGQGPTTRDALKDAYDNLQEEALRVAAKVWQLGQAR